MKSRRMRWAGHVARKGEKGNAYGLLVGKPEGRPRRMWVDNIKMELVELDEVIWTVLLSFRIRTSGENFLMQQ
jgi:superfamily II DNA/RNA helicase